MVAFVNLLLKKMVVVVVVVVKMATYLAPHIKRLLSG